MENLPISKKEWDRFIKLSKQVEEMGSNFKERFEKHCGLIDVQYDFQEVSHVHILELFERVPHHFNYRNVYEVFEKYKEEP